MTKAICIKKTGLPTLLEACPTYPAAYINYNYLEEINLQRIEGVGGFGHGELRKKKK